MTSTHNWLRRHRLAALTAAAVLTGLMVTPNFAEARHRRHARNCCCDNYGHSSYGHSHYGHSSYGYSNHGYSGHSYGGDACCGSSWGQPGYAHSGVQYGDSGIQYSDSQYHSQPQMSGQSYPVEAQPSIATPQGNQITANRPKLDEGSAPPAPTPDAPNDAAADSEAAARTGAQNGAQQTQQLQQRIDELEAENARLKQQLEEARKQADQARSAVDVQENQPAEEAAEAASAASAETDVPQLPDAKEETPVEAEAEE